MSLVGSDGEERLWHGDPAIWGERSPILFPVVGRLQGDVLRVDGRDLPMPIHGFARSMVFAASQLSEASALFSLHATEETRRAYPWDFRLDVKYTITEATLTITFTVSNHGSRPMPYMLGFHPGFRWPIDASIARNSHILEFNNDESVAYEIGRNGFRGETLRTATLTNRRLSLSDGFLDGGAAIFPDLHSRRVHFAAPGTGTGIELLFHGFAHLALWTRPSAPFLCIEPWQTLPHAALAVPDLSHAPVLHGGEAAGYEVVLNVAC